MFFKINLLLYFRFYFYICSRNKNDMIGSHNCYTFLPARKHWLEWFSFLWRTQDKNIKEQKDCGVRYFDVRVKYDPYIRMWRICHGIVDFYLVFRSLEDIANIFNSNEYRLRLILEKDTEEGRKHFINEISTIKDKYCCLSFACIKKEWEIIYNKDPQIIDYTYTPWLSGVSFWNNIKRFNFFSTIKRWAKKHNPVINNIIIEDNTVHFMDYIK